MAYEKLVVVTRKTRLAELVERFNTRSQAKFYIEHADGDFTDYEKEDDAYRASLDRLMAQMGRELKLQVIDRSLVPTFLFTEEDIVLTVGQDGLVANCAKYVGRQPLVAVNPDPARFDGVLLPFRPEEAHAAVVLTLAGKETAREVTLAEAQLADGQKLLAFNDFFLGAKSHISARYRIHAGDQEEPQSSSGLIVSTGAGSTGWLSSVFNMVAGIAPMIGGSAGKGLRLEWNDPRLVFVVREPFVSRYSQAQIAGGIIEKGQELVLESLMPHYGVIFSDGVEADYLEFNSGATVRVKAAAQRARLVVPFVDDGGPEPRRARAA